MRHNSLPKAFAPLQSFQALQALLCSVVFSGTAGTSALCSFFMHCRHFCALQFFQALQALLPLASCLQRYNKEAIIAHHWSARILPDGALFLASSLFPMALRIGAPSSIVFPMDFRHSASASRHPAKAPWPADFLPQRLSRTASPLQHLGQHLRCSALASQQLRRSARTSSFAAALRPATNLIRLRKVLRFG